MLGIGSARSRGQYAVVMAMLIASIGLVGCGATEPNGEPASGSRSTGSESETADGIAPSTPSGVTGAAVSPSQINLNWSASTDNMGVTGYRVYRNGVPLTTLSNVTTYQNTGLNASTTYSYTVQSIDGAGNASGQSTAAILTTPAALDTTAPSTPTGLTATAVSISRIDLSWSASTDNVAVTGYRVFRNSALLITLGNATTTYQDRGLTAGATYIYTVRALDAAGNVSGLSPTASATTLTTPDTIAPTVPDNLAAVAVGDSQIALSWLASTDNDVVAGYRVYRNGAFLIQLADFTTYQDTGLTASTTYSYNVDAIDAAGNVSGLSAAANATTLSTPDTIAPSTPKGLAANAVSPSQINLSWSASTDNVAVTGYRITRNGALLITLGNVTTYQDTGLGAATTYTYRVRALDAAGNVSGQSTAASATTPPVPDTTAPTTPSSLTANAISAGTISLNWSASTDNVAVAGYRLYRNGVFLVALGNVTTYQNTGLSASTTYSYNVDAIDAVGNASGISTAASATTLAPNTATLTWDAVTGASGYRIYYGTASGTYFQSVEQGVDVGNVTTYTVPGLSSGTYYFAATAYDTSNNESTYSNEISKVIP
jgi:chitodextrinase